MARLARLAPILVLAGFLHGCASLNLADETPDLPARVNLRAVPFYPQTEHHCGPAALATVLEHSKAQVDYRQLVDQIYVPGLGGSLQAEISAAIRSRGRLAYRLPPRPAALLEEVSAGHPVLILENLGLRSKPVWHYSVIVGFDLNHNRVLLRSGTEFEQSEPAGRWLRRWNRAGRWALVVLAPGQWPAAPSRNRWLEAAADFEATAGAAHAARVWRQTLERWPNEPVAWLGLGNSEADRNDFQAAIDAYSRLLELQPDHAAGRFNLAVALAETGRFCTARSLLLSLHEHPVLGARVDDQLRRISGSCTAD